MRIYSVRAAAVGRALSESRGDEESANSLVRSAWDEHVCVLCRRERVSMGKTFADVAGEQPSRRVGKDMYGRGER
jgi:hypothetical protein